MKPLNRYAYLVLLAVVALLVGADYRWRLFERVDAQAGDVLTRATVHARAPSPDIVIVNIDQTSLEQLNDEAGSWPWPRAIHAELVSAIAAQQPKAIVFDLLFNEADTFRADSDALLRDTIAATPGVYMPTVLLGDGQGAKLADLPASLGLIRTPQAQPDARAPLLLPLVLAPASWHGGLINFDHDRDGIGRHYLLYATRDGWRIPAMPATLARDFGWPHPDRTRMRLNWTPRHATVSYADIYLDAGRETPQRPKNEFTGKIVLIGTAAPGLMDLRPTPLSKTWPGIEILATAIDNLEHGNWLRDAPRPWFAALAITIAALLAVGFQLGINSLWLGVSMAAISVIGAGAMWLAQGRLWFLPLAMPLVWGWVYYALAALVAYVKERARREATVRLFGRFLDPRVVGQLVAGGAIDSAPAAREVTVLFSDIRGFTSLSETRQPEEVVALLNRYFSRQVAVVFRHGGTLDKFIGDAIMAFWGAPVDDADHARHAVAAALDMGRELEAFRAELALDGIDFDIGIGVHTGRAVVGFIGADDRLDYTAIGDTVNLASRIEGQTKGVARVLVSQATRDACGDRYHFDDRGEHHVKGRAEGTRLYEPRLIEEKR
ncbi:adenylate/guanylate cyclase domain-containing protein [Jeongeupia naejangsanensis]|uniref:Adenylate/guanylate cyclase domain-containing protein n=1 Tax=Jeongeupia naejangsanensis TaxID=613195 RepID=A0ABS2BNY0_9NEIS|nr:adenylate/guanylate cyclase domain-containing protein [Jeongeupia naejangsanensis]MBM3117342.1 adenylate/guanylate cyclase domain-containing protein [Jeongeupia naejangsanensis]